MPPQRGWEPNRIEELRALLSAAGARYTVDFVSTRYGLVERLPSGVVAVERAVVSSSARASDLLQRAWNAAYGVHPSPSYAYYDAVRAVEIFSSPLISPKDSSSTLGKDINVLRNKPEAWTFAMAGSSNARPSTTSLL